MAKAEEALDDVDIEIPEEVALREEDAALATLVRLADGDIHLCMPCCPLAVACVETGDLVCPHSGLVCGQCASERTDFSTGRSTWSNDPDMTSGSSGIGANGVVWRRRIDRVAASKAAHALATQLTDAAMPTAREIVSTEPTAVKRGALCVNEQVEEVGVVKKRQRQTKKTTNNNVDATNQLVVEAAAILNNLLCRPTTSVDVATTRVASSAMDPEKLFVRALQRYRASLKADERPCFSALHDIALTIDELVRTQASSDATNATNATSTKLPVKITEAVARLTVALWRSSCLTPYLGTSKRGGDSFSPFCVGVAYSLKRGLTLKDGTVIVPVCAAIDKLFPSSKAISANSNAKVLHASSHKGLCALHRSLASVDAATQARLYRPGVALANELLSACACLS